MQLFDYEDYKAFITADLAANSKVRGYKTQLAGAAGCQKSFFSHVHRGHVHLTPDHASALSSFWRFDETETEYFLTLVDIARAGTPHLRARLQQRARRLRTEKGKFETQLKHSEQQEGLNQTFYYSSWYWSALHILASIPEFQTPAKMADRLGLDIRFVLEALKELEKMGLLKKTKDRWLITDRSFHLAKDSPMAEMNHSNWRARAIIDVQRRSDSSFHYTSVFSMSVADAKKFREMVSDFTIATRKLIEPSREEELFCFNADFFKV